jgi:hypothetical protein
MQGIHYLIHCAVLSVGRQSKNASIQQVHVGVEKQTILHSSVAQTVSGCRVDALLQGERALHRA